MQYRALKGGARLERAINRGLDVVGEYDSRAQLILDYMQASPTCGLFPQPNLGRRDHNAQLTHGRRS